ncbi:tRNA lysidine(34) synthetase TilS [Sunxiuqinia elliptica]|uniref:tRNA(Ile)-lysidine synthase n=1 Tax=Sunxiuqinia elliptica TaxID=655355 RepID=A0A4R6GWU3_9BACT|nr:tRNA lysidine(34) synthetase TilS [Sunxiuqinia elliptica]TDN99999.1 tRNA(Ile)-lysidine synthase [Sunxiuqinia elliptica]TDO57191.1 tRNA(Ile)-lysidine synthase [Sunxiuqinia elliptica]
MLEKLKNNIAHEQLLTSTDRLVLAVSGGCDSMVMLDLFRQMEHDFVVAHCNFKLRGAESDGDETFLRDYCGEHGVELFVQTFETREYAVQEGISIEMAARELRYQWFYELLDSLQYNYLLTAHHQDDLVETMLINLSRGTGIRGLSGIHPRKGRLVRPLLFASRNDLVAYANEKQVPYREDSSNKEFVHQRNLIRHQVLPLLETINPAFKVNAAKTAAILKETELVFNARIAEEQSQFLSREGKHCFLAIDYLKASSYPETLLFETLKSFGFTADLVQEINQALYAEPGKVFYSTTHRLVKDRSNFILTPREEESISRYYIEKDCVEIGTPIKLSLQQLTNDSSFQFSKNRLIADLDFDCLEFPLVLKKWEQGEYFQPLGMTGFKKLSDFFIDQKFSIPEKENSWILYSGGKVVWVVGHRMDNRFKITSATQSVIRIQLSE